VAELVARRVHGTKSGRYRILANHRIVSGGIQHHDIGSQLCRCGIDIVIMGRGQEPFDCIHGPMMAASADAGNRHCRSVPVIKGRRPSDRSRRSEHRDRWTILPRSSDARCNNPGHRLAGDADRAGGGSAYGVSVVVLLRRGY